MLYEAATGQQPFTGHTTAVLFEAILNRAPVAPSRFQHSLAPALERLVMRLLEKDPRARYPGARELGAELRAVNSGSSRRGVEVRPKSPPSVAVLPFVNMSAEADQYFSDGLAEELINALTRLPGLKVASRTSAFRFRGGDVDIREVGRQLNVETVLEGSIRRAGARLRITVQLITVADGLHVWSERYDREMADVFDIQDEIVASIVKALAPALLGDAKDAVLRPTDNIEAYELYLKGRHHWHRGGPGASHVAIQLFEQAIAIDANYALAYAGQADCYGILRANGRCTFDAARSRGLAAVTRAIALAPTSAEVLCSQGIFTFYVDPVWHPAEAQFRKALGINPRFSMALAYLGLYLSCDYRRDEAVARIESACDIDPLSPAVHYMAGMVFNINCQFDKAERTARRVLELQPDSFMGWRPLGDALLGLERFDEALPVFERGIEISRGPNFVGLLGKAYARMGRIDDAKALLAELDARRRRGEYIPSYASLCIHAALGDVQEIRAGLEACVADQTPPLSIQVSCGPSLDQFRGDPTIDAALDRLYDGARPR